MTEVLLKLVKGFEGCRLEAYQDSVGVWTIGYGYTGLGVSAGLMWTQQKADEMLEQVLTKVQEEVKHLVTVDVTQNQLDALTSFAYNLGLGALGESQLLHKLNSGLTEQSAEEFIRWDRAGGVVLAGLLRRRTAERDLFLS